MRSSCHLASRGVPRSYREQARANGLGEEYEKALRFFAVPEAQRADIDKPKTVSEATLQIVERLLQLDAAERYGAMVLIRVPTINPDGLELYKKLSSTCIELGLHHRLAVLMCGGARPLRPTRTGGQSSARR
jgi:hypothetical protein